MKKLGALVLMTALMGTGCGREIRSGASGLEQTDPDLSGGGDDTGDDGIVTDVADDEVDPPDVHAAFFRADLDGDETFDLGVVHYPSGTTSHFELVGLSATDSVLDMQLSPDRRQIAVVVEDVGTPAAIPRLIVYDIEADTDTGIDPVLVARPAMPFASFQRIAWAPDGQHLTLVGDFEAQFQFLVYVVAANGSDALAPRRISRGPTDKAAQDAMFATWVDASRVVYVSDLEVDQQFNVYVRDISDDTAAPLPLLPDDALAPLLGVAGGPQVAPNGQVYFMSNHADGDMQLYKAEPDASSLELVPLDDGSGAEYPALVDFELSPTASQLAFVAQTEPGLYQLFTAHLPDGTATQRSAVQTTAAGPVSTAGHRAPLAGTIMWSDDERQLGVVADWATTPQDADDEFAAFMIPTNGPPGGLRIAKVATASANANAIAMALTRDGARLFISGNMRTGDSYDLYSTDALETADQDLLEILVPGLPADRDVWDFTVDR